MSVETRPSETPPEQTLRRLVQSVLVKAMKASAADFGITINTIANAGDLYQLSEDSVICSTVPQGAEFIEIEHSGADLLGFLDKVYRTEIDQLAGRVNNLIDDGQKWRSTISTLITQKTQLEIDLEEKGAEVHSWQALTRSAQAQVRQLIGERDELLSKLRGGAQKETASDDYSLVGLTPNMFQGLDRDKARKLIQRTRKHLSNIYHPESQLLPNEAKMKAINATLDTLLQRHG